MSNGCHVSTNPIHLPFLSVESESDRCLFCDTFNHSEIILHFFDNYNYYQYDKNVDFILQVTARIYG